MAFRTPAMPLTANYWTNPPNPPPTPGGTLRTVSCQLRLMKTAMLNAVSSGFQVGCCLLLVPKGTDIRMPGFSWNATIVEVPAGSGRFYSVQSVDDVAKGFSNEYRVAALITYNTLVGCWPAPYA